MTTRNWIAAVVLMGLMTGVGERLHAQDLHFSQYYNAPLNTSPALTGVFSGDIRMGANARQQWASVPVPYLTFSGYYDRKIYVPGLTNGLLGGGILFNYDKAGDGNLSWAQIGLAASYTQQIAETHYLTGGAMLQLGQRAFDPTKLNFDDQYNGDIFDPTLASAESFPKTSVAYTDLSAGINWLMISRDNRNEIVAGIAFYHLTQPAVGFFDDRSATLPMRSAVYTHGVVQVAEKLDVVVHGAWQLLSPQREILAGAGARYHLLVTPLQIIALQAGLSYRLSDALIPHIELHYNDWMVGLSYDINTSPFQVATARRGGPEISLRYIITKVKPPDAFKSCPVF